MRRLVVLAAAVAVASSVGCANARYIQKNADEGVVAVGSNTDTWPSYNRTNALKLIEAHVGPGYEIVDEREVANGVVETNRQDTDRQAVFNPNNPFLPAEKQTTTTTTTTTPRTEYHITYRRAARSPVAVGSGGSIPPPHGPSVLPAGYAAPSASPATLSGAPTGGIAPPDLSGLNN
jgi:hypothetical protein